MIMLMKAIQLTMDEELLEALDASEEVRREGRSAVVRRATAEYLQRSRRREIARQYREGYQGENIGEELEGWTDEGVWPE
jgi:metal-responsive CopG/Arc/MetJ family transcriptional regulator